MKFTTLLALATAALALPHPGHHAHHKHAERNVVEHSHKRDDSDLIKNLSGGLKSYADPEEFQDGVHSCDKVPAGNGVVSVDWVDGLKGGWTSVMNSNAQTSETCKDGYFCSYSCAAGMSKTQWPSNQPGSGATVGGLECRGGKLYRTNPDEKALCKWDQKKDDVSAGFLSKVDKGIAICRTDYPGSENMNCPTWLEPKSDASCSVVDSDKYFTWKGGKTSTQYYVNNAGVSIEEGCIWGTEGSGVGNWAPVVLGAGTTGGLTYLSLIPNPNNRTPPNYNVEIVGSEGANVVGSCKYENGKYTGSGSDGCTVTVVSGKANFVFY
ncbi:probable secreted beta-glucosidase Uth1p [Diutina catenulata]